MPSPSTCKQGRCTISNLYMSRGAALDAAPGKSLRLAVLVK